MAAAKENGVTEEDVKEITKLVENLRRSNAVLRTETEMLESFYSRLDPSDLVPQATPESAGAASSMDMGGCAEKSKVQQESQRLTLEQKCYIAEREIEAMKKDQEKLIASSKREAFKHKATIKEAGIQLAQIRKERLEFERFVAKLQQEKNTPEMIAEKVRNYIEDEKKSKARWREIEKKKLQRENKALSVHLRKLLRQKEESKALNSLDFQKIKIEKIQYLEKLNECNQTIRQLKTQYRNKQQSLNSYKKKLETLTVESKSLDKAIASRKEKIAKIQERTKKAKKERDKAKAENKKLRAQMADANVPTVMDYIAVKTAREKLQKSVKAGERKLRIAQMELKTHTKAWKKLCAASGGQLASNVTTQNPKLHTPSSTKQKQVNVGSSLLDSFQSCSPEHSSQKKLQSLTLESKSLDNAIASRKEKIQEETKKAKKMELKTHTKAWKKLCAASGGQLASNVTTQNPKLHTPSSTKQKQVNVGSSLLDSFQSCSPEHSSQKKLQSLTLESKSLDNAIASRKEKIQEETKKAKKMELKTHTKAWKKLCAASGGQLASNVTTQNPKLHTPSSTKQKQVNVGSSLLDSFQSCSPEHSSQKKLQSLTLESKSLDNAIASRKEKIQEETKKAKKMELETPGKKRPGKSFVLPLEDN